MKRGMGFTSLHAWTGRAAAIVVLLIASNLAFTIFNNVTMRSSSIVEVNGREQVEDVNYDQMPPALRWIGRFSNSLLMAAGVAFGLGAFRDKTQRGAQLAYVAMCVWSAYLLLARTTVISEVLGSYSLFGNIAPGTIAALGLFFLGSREKYWPQLRDAIVYLILAASVALLIFTPLIDFGSRESGRAYQGSLTAILEYVAIFPILAGSPRIPRLIRVLPIFAAVVGGVFTQTRTTFAFLFVQIAVVAWHKRKQFLTALVNFKMSANTLVVGFGSFVCVIALGIGLSSGPQARSLQSFADRFTEDTRSSQLAEFFNKTEPGVFVFGAGYPTAGEFSSEGEDGIDAGYVNTLYVGGIPALLFVLYLFVLPGARASRFRLQNEDLAVVACVVSFATGMLSSSVMELKPEILLFALLAGRAYRVCVARAEQGRELMVAQYAH